MALAIEMAMMVGFINTKPHSSTASDAMIAPWKKYTDKRTSAKGRPGYLWLNVDILGCYHRAGLRTRDRVGVKTKSLKQLLRQQLYPRLGAKVASSKGLHG